MFSSRRRVLGRRARTRLVLLGIVSIASLFVMTRSPDFTPAWLSLVRQARAQSDTPPTLVPQPNPTAGLSEPPLTLQSAASVASAVAGEQFSFMTTIATASEGPRAVDLRASIDGQLELLSVSGSCSGGTALSCKLNVQRDRPATIVATVRVRRSAVAGSRLVYQALAQDDLSNTAASDQVVVTIAPAPISPTTPPTPPDPTPPDPTPPDPTPRPPVAGRPANDASAPARPTVSSSRPAALAPTARPAGIANSLASSTRAPTVLALPVVPAAILRSSAGAATISTNADAAAPVDSWLVSAPGVPASDGAAPVDSWLVSAPGVPASAQALNPVVPAQVASEQEVPALASLADVPVSAPVVAEQRQIVQLPNTAVAPPITGLVAVLLGLGLTIHGLRRVRRAAAQLDRQRAALGRLAKLAGAQARRRARIGDRPSDSHET